MLLCPKYSPVVDDGYGYGYTSDSNLGYGSDIVDDGYDYGYTSGCGRGNDNIIVRI